MSPEDEAMLACVHLAERAGAVGIDVGYVDADNPRWYMVVSYRGGAAFKVEGHTSASDAAIAMAHRIMRDATCRCGRMVTVVDGLAEAAWCRWRRAGPRWVSSCNAPLVPVSGPRGDLDAIVAAKARLAAGLN